MQTNHFVEAMTTLQITNLAKDQGISKLWLEGDSMNIVNCLNEVVRPSWNIDNIT